MRVAIVSGIWPPDVGGPASHAPAVAAFLRSHGHTVEVVTTAAAAPEPRDYPVAWTRRSLPPGVRHLDGARRVAAAARRSDVVYTTGMIGRSSAGALAARAPYVVKLTADPAFERLRRRGRASDLEAFQDGGGGMVSALARTVRDVELSHAAHVVTPSAYLGRLAAGWGVPDNRITVLPNPAPVAPAPSKDGVSPSGELAFAGRLTEQKALDVALRAVAAVPDVRLTVAGDGPVRRELDRLVAELGLGDRVTFVGPLRVDGVLDLYRRADAAVISSAWENFPHAVVEALAVGTPVIGTSVGGVAEVVTNGENGLLVPPGDPAAFGAAIARFYAEPDLRRRITAAAAPSVERYAPERILGELEQLIVRAAA